MNQASIPRDQWPAFCAAFSDENRSWPVTMEVEGQGGAKTVVARGRPLMGISYEPDDGMRSIRVMLGEEPGGHMTRAIIDPSSMVLGTDDAGVVEMLQIQSMQGITTIRFEPQGTRSAS